MKKFLLFSIFVLSALSGQGRDSLSAALRASRGEVDFVQALTKP